MMPSSRQGNAKGFGPAEDLSEREATGKKEGEQKAWQKGTNYVLDSFVLIGYLENEPFAQEIEDLLHQAEKGVSRLYLHALHLGEVYYITLREQGQDVADLAYARIKRFPVKFVETINEELLLTAATLKANYPISMRIPLQRPWPRLTTPCFLLETLNFVTLKKIESWRSRGSPK